MKKFLITMSLLFSMHIVYAASMSLVKTAIPEVEITQQDLDVLQRKANSNNGFAQLQLAEKYQDNKEYQLANQWFQKASDNKVGYASYRLANNYLWGRGVVVNQEKAFQLANLAVQQGELRANFMLGQLYLQGRGVKKDETTALHKFLQTGNDDGMVATALVKLYCTPSSQFYDKNTCTKWTMIATQLKMEENTVAEEIRMAKLGSVYSQLLLALRYTGEYVNKYPVPKNYQQALYWCKKAADQGYDAAQYMLGEMYYAGDKIPRNYPEAMKYFTLSARQGYDKSQYALGLMSLKGIGVKPDKNQAYFWLNKASEQNNAEAQNLLGLMYFDGNGVKKDISLTASYFKKSCENGSKEGCVNFRILKGMRY